MKSRWKFRTGLACAIGASLQLMMAVTPVTAATAANEPDEPSPASATPASTTQAPANPSQTGSDGPIILPATPASMPFVRVNREQRWVDIDAAITLRQGHDVRLLLCVAGTRAYESILTTQARPSHLHLSLMMVGLTPGSPLKWVRQGSVLTAVAPQGPTVELTLRYQHDGQIVEVPASQWVIDPQADAPLATSRWMFTGSPFTAVEDKSIYQADVTGSVISLTPSGDEVLTYTQGRPARPGPLGDAGYVVNTAELPQIDTPVVVRIQVIPPPSVDAQADTQASPAAKPEPASTSPAPLAQEAPSGTAPAATSESPAEPVGNDASAAEQAPAEPAQAPAPAEQ